MIGNALLGNLLQVGRKALMGDIFISNAQISDTKIDIAPLVIFHI